MEGGNILLFMKSCSWPFPWWASRSIIITLTNPAKIIRLKTVTSQWNHLSWSTLRIKVLPHFWKGYNQSRDWTLWHYFLLSNILQTTKQSGAVHWWSVCYRWRPELNMRNTGFNLVQSRIDWYHHQVELQVASNYGHNAHTNDIVQGMMIEKVPPLGLACLDQRKIELHTGFWD